MCWFSVWNYNIFLFSSDEAGIKIRGAPKIVPEAPVTKHNYAEAQVDDKMNQ